MSDNDLYSMLKDALSSFKDSVDKEVAEVHKCKNELAYLKMVLSKDLEHFGHYLRDEGRIIISAPEIVIGNVDRSGKLMGGGSVVIRGGLVNVEGAGTSGAVVTKAPHVTTLAVDPGNDGFENVVYPGSGILQKGQSVSIESESTQGSFVSMGAIGGAGVSIISDTSVLMEASVGNESLTKRISACSSSSEKLSSDLSNNISAKKKAVDDLLKAVQDTLKKQRGLSDNDEDARGNMCDILANINTLETLLPQLYVAVNECTDLLSRVAEAKRVAKDMKAAKEMVSKAKQDYKKKNTGRSVVINAENLKINSVDGDSNIRDTETSGITVNAANYKISSSDAKGALIEKGTISMNAKNINVSTADFKKKDQKNADKPAVGDIRIVSKNLNFESVDYELKDGKDQIKALTAGGTLGLRAENMLAGAVDKEGKATGRLSLNAKVLEIKSMDVDKDKGTDKQLASGSTAVFVSEKIYEGGTDSKNKSKQVQITSEKVGIFAKTTAELQQEKAVLQLDGGNASLAGGKAAVFGALTVNAATTFKDKIQAPGAAIDNLEAKTSFKSTNISDGIAVPAPAAPANLSAKLKEEDAPKKQ